MAEHGPRTSREVLQPSPHGDDDVGLGGEPVGRLQPMTPIGPAYIG